MTPKNIRGLEKLLNEAEKSISDFARHQPEVSAGTVGWHIDHLLLTMALTLKNMSTSSPQDYRKEYNFWRTVCLGFRWLPRGKVKAPKVVTPVSIKEEKQLMEQLENIRQAVREAVSLHPLQFMKHPFFGKLKRDTAFRFLEIHTRHHLKIIEHIRK